MDVINKFYSLIKNELFDETILETEHIQELYEIEDFLSVLVEAIRFVLRLNEFYDGFVSLLKYANWKKSQVIQYDFRDNSPSPSKEDYHRLACSCNRVYSDSGLIEVIKNSTALGDLTWITSLLIDLQILIRTAREESCWTELKSRMLLIIGRMPKQVADEV